ncbi:AraC family transcriptional regulator [Allohahella marinimesophila]|uniref:AraC family transcriptional regulator n=2 Tax=Allohahella marinimesophila TaxID=1054972 RepID=A0ABP7PDY9_9GAMM
MAPDGRFQLTVLHDVLDYAVSVTKNPCVGLLIGAEISTSSMGVIGHILFNNRTLGEALTQYVRLAALVNEGLAIELEVDDGEAIVSFEYIQPALYHAVNIDRMLVQTVARAKKYVSEQVFMTRVGFHHEEPASRLPYDEYFDCPLNFSEPRSYIAFDHKFLDFELPQRNPYLHQALSRQVESLLGRLRQHRSLSARVRHLISGRLSQGDFDAEAIASELCISRHTLYRRLKAEGNSFHDIIESARRDKAVAYLRKNKYALSEIAFLLGFSELSAFSRAFKRWTGQSPASYRRSNGSGPAKH